MARQEPDSRGIRHPAAGWDRQANMHRHPYRAKKPGGDDSKTQQDEATIREKDRRRARPPTAGRRRAGEKGEQETPDGDEKGNVQTG